MRIHCFCISTRSPKFLTSCASIVSKPPLLADCVNKKAIKKKEDNEPWYYGIL